MGSTQYEALIRLGSWVSYDEYSGKGTRLLQINSGRLVIEALQSLLLLLFALSIPCLVRVTARLYLWHCVRRYEQKVALHDSDPANDELVNSQTDSLPSIGNISNRRVRSSIYNPNNATGPDKPEVTSSWTWWSMTIPLCILWIALGIWLSMLSTSEDFLITSDDCGITSLSAAASYAQYLEDQQYQAARERVAAEEVELCGSTGSMVDQARCSLLEVEVDRCQPCPFTQSSHLCQSDNSTTILKTGWRSIRKLGFNTEADILFQHTATCSPLVMEHPRLIAEPLDMLKLAWLHSYYYGSVDGLYSSYQLISTVYNFKERYATFAADVLSENRHARYDRNWTADPGLHHPVNTSLTLIFASRPPSMHNYNTNDPDTPIAAEVDTSDLPVPIACVEHQEFCNGDKTKCYSTIKSDNPAEFELISQLMQRSSLADAIRYSGGRAVLRDPSLENHHTFKIIDSSQINNIHWSRALERQFKTSLAILYNNMREFALGLGEKGDAYIVDDRLSHFCGNYKVKLHHPRLWAVKVWWWLCFAAIPLLLFLLTRKWELSEWVMGYLPESMDEWGVYESDVGYWFEDRVLVFWGLVVKPWIWVGERLGEGKSVRLP